MTQAEMVKLLGRPLTSVESTNFTTYLDLAILSLEDLLCTPLESVNETRVFDTRKGYSTAFVDIFNDVSSVSVDGVEIEAADYSKRQWDKRNGSWYNSLVFDDKFTDNGEIEVTADWGFVEESGDDSDYPLDLQSVLAGLFAEITKKNKFDPTVESKQVEDFRITFRGEADLDEAFYNTYRKTINKYSLCDIPNVQQGKLNCEY